MQLHKLLHTYKNDFLLVSRIGNLLSSCIVFVIGLLLTRLLLMIYSKFGIFGIFGSFETFYMKSHNTSVDEMNEQWLSLQEASSLLGVAASTLRRWGDSGRVPMKKTLGGHRRFSRIAVEQLIHSDQSRLPSRTAPRSKSTNWGVNEHELARQEWHTRLAARSDASRMRGLGQQLLGLLIQYINRREDDERFLDEARIIGEHYGHETQQADVSMHDTVEAFLFFRRSFSQLAMPLPGIAQPTDLVEAAELHARIGQFMDAVLLGVITGYETGHIAL
ncbi:MAG: helix-turn-helix domain-containing protein [Chloroflexi bacterium AL-W]|nr:helix-turn-helix domain-containing protein [Chloroflexi bacterium AL-N1]NOK69208.1 helix-turn-helix domain-containing protein [Chloroflexi bacterium AL-N10]NOK77191.1 helix-turn-helix domain-containing protein [Chloroflexi bacterium AL-N5]NOK83836.1 helix-turn-helix domain-containing protein [Chloroflexi bacterium AL-W]NOK91046.1 helix-turn-helix domain-containing protein [Chloroflexi bacterium AL-N15]